MVLSDKSIREELESGGIVIEPLEEGALQPSSVDLRVDRFFRVFRNDTTPFIDPKRPQEDLTELVEVEGGGAFILHPGEFVLGSTLERVALGPNLVARLEGKSSLGRLGLLIHSSLPASELVMVLSGGRLEARPIGEVVERRVRGSVVSFDPATFEVGYHRITGWYQGPPDRIYEVRLASGRWVRVTAGHNLFTLDQADRLSKIRTGELRPGSRVAIPHALPEPPEGATRPPVSSRPVPSSLIPTGSPPRRALQPAARRASESTHAARRVGGAAIAIAALPASLELDAELGDLRWDSVIEVRDTGTTEPIYDLEVRPGNRKVENYLAGNGGVFVSNTAGFVDAGWDGHLTLELSNVANLPIAIYPGMMIGQISFLRMSTEAEQPYGSEEKRSKYQGQRGPTPSRYYLNFRDDR